MQENPQIDNGLGMGGVPPRQPLGRNQKIAAAILAVFSIFLLIMWSVELNKSITGPFSIAEDTALSSNTPQEDTSNPNNPDGLSDAQVQDLKSKDTDGDGLSDYDELYVYHTSPYLADSDSDGIPDGVEIKNGTDPNCPSGKVCAQPSNISTSSIPQLNQAPDANSTTNNPGVNSSVSASTSASALQTILQGQSDAASLRKALINAGMDPRLLQQISDQELMKSYKDTLGGISASSSPTTK